MSGVELVEVVRNGFRESVHRGSVVLLAPDGSVRRAVGEVGSPMLPRSANKPGQAVAMLRAGLAPADPGDLAVATASHNGEPGHVAQVRGLLAGHGLTEDDLRCPADLPLHAPSARAVLADGGGPARVLMNCSGKHAAMLATCRARGWPTGSYLEAEHPLQQQVAATLAELAGEPVTATVVDGCGAPQHALSLTGLARVLARIATAPAGTAEHRVAAAMRAHPFLVAGTGREDTRLMSAVPGLVCKVGAEGVHAGALPDGGAFAVKIDDGSGRGRLPVAAAALRELGVPTGQLTGLDAEPVRGGGDLVGEGDVVGAASVIAGALDG